MIVCHLILKHQYYDAIDRGDKTVEYRRNCPYWRKRLKNANVVVFHRGYTKQTMVFQIALKVFADPIEIHLGDRICVKGRLTPWLKVKE